MTENNTQETNQSKSFEERVFLRFDAVDARFNSVDARLDSVDARLDSVDSRLGSLEGRIETLEQKQYDTKPIWEKALAEITETNAKMEQGFAQVNAEFVTLRNEIEHSIHGVEMQIDALNQNVLQVQVNQRYVNKRLHDLESEPKST